MPVLDDALGQKIMALALGRITPAIRSMMLRNLAASGVKSRTGVLKRAVANCQLQQKRGVIIVHLPKGLTVKQIKYINSVNYGAVHSSQNIGNKAKRSIKKAYEKGEAVKEKTLRAQRQQHSNMPLSRRGRIDLGGVKLHRAFNFFKLSPTQQKTAQQLHAQAFNEYLQKELSRVAA